MDCKNCGKRIQEGHEFCMECGSKIELITTPVENKKVGIAKFQRLTVVGIVSIVLIIGLGFYISSLNSSPVEGVNKDLYTATMEMITYYESDAFIERFGEAIKNENSEILKKEIEDKYAALEPLCKSEEDKIYYEAFETICSSLQGSAMFKSIKTELIELAESAGKSNDANIKDAVKEADRVIGICTTHIQTFKNATTVEEVKPLIGLDY